MATIGKTALSALVLFTATAVPSRAALYDRGNGLIYNDALNITLTKNAALFFYSMFTNNPNLVSDVISASNGVIYDTADAYNSGQHHLLASDIGTYMNWWGAQAWVNYLNKTAYAGYSDWRLPVIKDTGTPGCNYANNGTDCGYNVDLSTSELAYIYSAELHNVSLVDANGLDRPNYNYHTNGTFPDAAHSNIADSFYAIGFAFWSGTEYAPISSEAWLFDYYYGYQGPVSKASSSNVWVVRSGDVAAVPLPGGFSLAAIGLALLSYRCQIVRLFGMHRNRLTSMI